MDDFPIEIYEEALHWHENDDVPAFVTENRAPTLDEQNQVFDWYKEVGITEGCPGDWSREYILQRVYEIEHSFYDNDVKYFLLDSLNLGLPNNYDKPVGDWSVYEYVARTIDKYI